MSAARDLDRLSLIEDHGRKLGFLQERWEVIASVLARQTNVIRLFLIPYWDPKGKGLPRAIVVKSNPVSALQNSSQSGKNGKEAVLGVDCLWSPVYVS